MSQTLIIPVVPFSPDPPADADFEGWFGDGIDLTEAGAHVAQLEAAATYALQRLAQIHNACPHISFTDIEDALATALGIAPPAVETCDACLQVECICDAYERQSQRHGAA